MKQSERVTGCSRIAGFLTGILVFGAVQSHANPYQSIVERNVFALRAAPRPEDTPPPQVPAPPIELQGITVMFGKKQVMFSIGSKPGEPPKKTSMLLKEGEREGEVEVLHIDEKNGIVKFNNHGKEEEKSLEKDSAKLPTGPPPAPMPGIALGTPAAPAAQHPGPPMGAGSAGATLRSIPMPSRALRGPTGGSTLNTPSTAPPGVSGLARGPGVAFPVPTATPITPKVQPVPQPTISAEEQAAMMLINQELNKGSGAPPLPPIPGFTDQ